MAKRKRENSEKQNEKKKKEGRGLGILSDYMPWINIHDFPSKGISPRTKGWKTNREHHFLSQLELKYFFLLEWSEQVFDIREQFPLHLEETLALAKNLKIVHPPRSNPSQPLVMTTDFLITINLPIGSKEVARTVKYSTDLKSKRVLEKFEIERQYWTRRNISWGIVTEKDIDSVLADNIKAIHALFDIGEKYPDLTPSIIDEAKHLMTELLNKEMPICEIAKICDEKLSLPPGQSLTIAQYLVASRQWKIDLSQQYPFETSRSHLKNSCVTK